MLRKILDSPWPYFALAAVLLVAGVLSQIEFERPKPPREGPEALLDLRDRDDLNVIFILVDTLRADRLQPYGYERPTSPFLDRLASRGIVFDHVESQSSWTKASMASLWLGMYPERTGVQRFMHGVPAEAVMPAELFQEAGYRTAGIWRNGWVANNFGFDQGFDLYYRPSRNKPVNAVRKHNPGVQRIPGTDLDATESAMEFILGNVQDRFFLYIHYMDVHQYLYTDTTPDFGTAFPDIYDMSIHWTDQNIKLLMEMLEEQGLADKTLVVISSDHGEAFWEHGMEGHARNLYRETQEVPWIIVPPFELERIDVEERVANIDVWPTILDLVGIPAPPGMDGRSLVPLILASAGIESPEAEELRSRTLFSQLDRSWGQPDKDSNPIIAAVRDDHRYVEFILKRDEGELFDRSEDPLERFNLLSKQEDKAEELRGAIDGLLEAPKPEWGGSLEVELDEMKRNQLRALGYVIPAQDRRKAAREEAEQEGGEAADGADTEQ